MERLLTLMAVFFKIGLFSIGGGYAIIPLIQAQVVDQFGWITQKTFTDIITISQMTPGPLAVNTSTFIGMQIAGLPGALFGTVCCVSSGVGIAVVLYHFYRKRRQSLYVAGAMQGLKAGSLGLIISAATTILLLTFTGTEKWGSGVSSIDWIAAVVFMVSFAALRKWKAHPVCMMLAAGVAGGILYGLKL